MNKGPRKLTSEEIAEVERRLSIPQAKHVVAHYMQLTLAQVLKIAHDMRGRGRPYGTYGDSEAAVSVSTPERKTDEVE